MNLSAGFKDLCIQRCVLFEFCERHAKSCFGVFFIDNVYIVINKAFSNSFNAIQ